PPSGVGRLPVDLAVAGAAVDPLVVVGHRHGQRALGAVLADHVLVEVLLDLLGGGNGLARLAGLALLVLGQDLVAERDALVADVHRRARNELPDRVLALAAEGAAQVLVVGHRVHRRRAGTGDTDIVRPGPGMVKAPPSSLPRTCGV